MSALCLSATPSKSKCPTTHHEALQIITRFLHNSALVTDDKYSLSSAVDFVKFWIISNNFTLSDVKQDKTADFHFHRQALHFIFIDDSFLIFLLLSNHDASSEGTESQENNTVLASDMPAKACPLKHYFTKATIIVYYNNNLLYISIQKVYSSLHTTCCSMTNRAVGSFLLSFLHHSKATHVFAKLRWV